ncbi:hypothetical protein CI109_102247 [Kwoniella shandongensis]|uniref:Uncharacterized protein n=1 Tax=Kwoniella shandongensis TaxID=1734106 RepID=A0A5M6C303_9TREE|nr:uncharacterized protein CI109_003599 [Kwoniella shandongensis]KAA5527945.1 hypothetical protein CI109_003599 [Kwoniella shandongensis]
MSTPATRAPPPRTTRRQSSSILPTTQPATSTTAEAGAAFPRLTRTGTSGSYHAQNALRRMATHETGEFVDEEHDGAASLDDVGGDGGLHTHDEHEGEGSDHSSSNHHESPGEESAEMGGKGNDEEAKIDGKSKSSRWGKKKEVELQDQTNLLPVRQVVLVFCGLTCALFCSLLDQTIVTTALPTLGKVFSRADISSWVGTAYLLTSTCAQPIYGRISDIFGRKFTLLACIFIFFIGSMACALAQTMIQLIVFRAIQGVGGGGILTLSMIIISDVVSLKERGKYQGIAGGVVALANSCGPILGGVFTEKATWRWCFYINLPLSAIAFVTIVFILPLRRVRGSAWEKLKKLDFYGSLLTLAWASLVLIALSWAGSQYSWSSAAVLAPLIIGLALLGIFIFVEAKVVSLPLVPMHIFNSVSVSACYFTTFMNGMAFYATLYYLPQYFQVVRGDSAIRSGVLMLPLLTVQTFFSFGAGILQSKTGDYWWNLVIGFALWTVGLGLISSVDANASIAKLAGYQVIVGVGAGQTFQTSLIAIQAAVSRKDMATATGLRNFLRMLGGTIALAVSSTIVNNSVKGHLKGVLGDDVYKTILADPTQANTLGLTADQLAEVTVAYAKGINAVFWYCTPCIGICVPITILLIKKIELKREDDAAKRAEAKAWVESKKAKKLAKKANSKHGHGHVEHDSEQESEHDSEEDRRIQTEKIPRHDSEGTVVGEIEEGVEQATKKMAEGALGMSEKEKPGRL